MNTLLQLGKFRLSLLVVFTAAAGYILGSASLHLFDLLLFCVATQLSAMGANGLNQWWERDLDKKMSRTQRRPIPSGKLTHNTALLIASTWLASGVAILFWFFNAASALLALATGLIYLFCYTPMKTRSALAVLIGAIPGAIPPVMGWVAATGELTFHGWILGCVLYLWQIPHFMSLACMLKDDYHKGGFRLLPDNPLHDKNTRAIILVFSVSLLCISLLTPLTGMGKFGFIAGALLCGGLMVKEATANYLAYSPMQVRRLFIGSLYYLPCVLTLLILDHKILPAMSLWLM